MQRRFKKELKKRSRNVGGEGYTEGYGGLKQLDLSEGSGPAVQQGDSVTVCCLCPFSQDLYARMTLIA